MPTKFRMAGQRRWTGAAKGTEKAKMRKESQRMEKAKTSPKEGLVGTKRQEKRKGKESQQKEKEDKGKGKPDGKSDGKGKTVNNLGAGKQCHVCGKHGHVAKNCWWKVSGVDGEDRSVQPAISSNQPQSPTGGSSTVGAVREGYDAHTKYVFTIGSSSVAAVSNTEEHKYLLIDSGACENVAHFGDFDAAIDGTKKKLLFGVQGNPLKVYGKQYPAIQAGKLKGIMNMTVTDVAESLLSVHVQTRDQQRLGLELHGKVKKERNLERFLGLTSLSDG